MKVTREMFRTVRWLLIGALAVQLIIVPWREQSRGGAGGLLESLYVSPLERGYAPIFSRPVSVHGVNASRLLVQLAVTGGLLLLWLRVAKPEE